MKGKIKYGIIIIIFIIIFGFNVVNSYGATGSIYLGLKGKSTQRDTGTYLFNNKDIFKIAKYSSAGVERDDGTSIYCLKGGPGFGSESYNNSIINYTQYFDIKDPDSMGTSYRNQLPEDINTYNKLVWVLDHLYIPEMGSTQEEIELANKTKKDLLDNAGVAQNSFLRNESKYANEIKDILECIQQIAIWHFTNVSGDDYYNNYTDRLELKVKEGNITESLVDKYGLSLVDNEIDLIYKYLVQEADEAVKKGYTYEQSKQSPIRLNSTNVKVAINHNNYIVGPYKIEEIGNGNYTMTAKLTDGTNDITNATILNQDQEEITEGSNISEKINSNLGKNFYISIPIENKIPKVKIEINTEAYITKQTMWTTGENSHIIIQKIQ